ncbi:MAG: hypothetical protein RIC14_07775 [Filomicrobium sp.]
MRTLKLFGTLLVSVFFFSQPAFSKCALPGTVDTFETGQTACIADSYYVCVEKAWKATGSCPAPDDEAVLMAIPPLGCTLFEHTNYKGARLKLPKNWSVNDATRFGPSSLKIVAGCKLEPFREKNYVQRFQDYPGPKDYPSMLYDHNDFGSAHCRC